MKGKPIILVDLETFGLDTSNDRIMEIGFMILDDYDLTFQSFKSWIISSPAHKSQARSLLERWDAGQISELDPDYFVAFTHTRNGLLSEVAEGSARANNYTVSIEVANWLTDEVSRLTDTRVIGNKLGVPLAGNSVHFDRAMLKYWMPNVEKLFTYRNEDISSVKNFVNRWMPKVAELREAEKVEPVHRVIYCLEAAAEELRLYKDCVFVGSE